MFYKIFKQNQYFIYQILDLLIAFEAFYVNIFLIINKYIF